LFSWGENEEGALGDGSKKDRKVPIVQVADFKILNAKDAFSAGEEFSVAIDTNGHVWTWGRNSSAELGIDNLSRSLIPVRAETNETIYTSVSAGKDHVLGITNGKIFAWGSNTKGQLGDGRLRDQKVPVQESSNSADWESISAGAKFSAAIKTDGTLWSWGTNDFGQLGDGAQGTKLSPEQESRGDTDWRSVCTGKNHTIALKDNGTLWAWGDNSLSQLGNGTNTQSSDPIAVTTVNTDWIEISCGGNHTLALRDDGTDITLWAWGNNSFGQLGTNDNVPYNVATQETTMSLDWESIAAGGDTSSAIKVGGVRYAWGLNGHLQYGNGTSNSTLSPDSIPEGL